MTPMGSFFAQSTDATGHFKDAKYLKDDISKAVTYVGEENVFIVALDGACKRTMQMIWEDSTMNRITFRAMSDTELKTVKLTNFITMML